MNILKLSLAFVMMSGYLSGLSQLHNAEEIAIEYMQAKVVEEGYDVADFQDFEIIHAFESAHNGVTHMYIVQRYQGVEVEHAIFNVNILPDGNVFHHGNKGVKQIASKVAKTTPSVGCHEAFSKCLTDVGIAGWSPKVRSEKRNEVRFVKPDGLFDDVLVRKIYALQPNGTYRMVWDMNVIGTETGEALHYQVDVATGEILKKADVAIKCQYDHKAHDVQCRPTAVVSKPLQVGTGIGRSMQMGPNQMMMDNAQYNVFPLPGESPNHINRTVVTNVADAMASPFGWHDTDGVAGAEYTITQGNNVQAVADHDGDGLGDQNEPDGGANLIFDFSIDLNAEPKTYTDASVANLFYLNNVMHDIAYRYGFDEASGNFQETNYSGEGAGGDYVIAFAQSKIDEEASGDTRNNATFATGAEGFKSKMNMFVWERGVAGANYLEILSPSGLAGTTFRSHQATFGPRLTSTGVTGSVVEAVDFKACGALTNPSEMSGKIALIERGICNFDLKIQNAKNAGAIAVVVCNVEEGSIRMGGTIDSGIPAIMVGNQDCQIMQAAIAQGELQIRLKEPPLTGPDQVDGTLDNGIVAHEYGHGISTRLVGGAQRRCLLSSDQQMGEGWSDFFTLITSVENGDTGATPRGIGTFVQRDDTDGLGIRRFPYTTDMSINPLTLGDIILTGTSPHALGTVWCSMIWDLYWALAERDGFDPDVYAGTGGNNKAIQLVMDGMKMMDCSPSFIDARDAILAADVANYGGANQQLIWEVFARRGLGDNAITESDSRKNVVEAFDVPGQYDPGLKIEKTMTALINPGDDITVTLTVTNDFSTDQSNVVLNDFVPAGASYVNNSASQVAQVNGDQVQFNLGSLTSGSSTSVTYKLNSGGATFSDFIWFDGFEEDNGSWIEEVVEGTKGWGQSATRKYNENFSYFIENDTLVTDRSLRVASPISLSGYAFPVLRFYHYIKSERGYDPGIVQLSRNGGTTWDDAGPLMFKNGYTGKIPYQPFAVANQRGFYGDSEDFLETYVDLRNYIGDDLLFRFRYGSNDEVTDEGWYVDEVSVFDMKNFQSEACVSSAETTTPVCIEAESNGAILNYDLALDVDEPNLKAISQVDLYPNPASDLINITITGQQITRLVDYKVFNVSGKYMAAGQLIPSNGNVNHPIDVSILPHGMYFVSFTVGDQQVAKRFVKH